jgi:ribonuclease P protein component
MLARPNRLTTTKDFEAIKERGKLIQSESFAFAYLDRGDSNPNRFGFIISAKIDKRATARNKARRALREAVRFSLSTLKPGHDCVFLGKSVIVKKYTSELMKEVEEVFKKSKLLK